MWAGTHRYGVLGRSENMSWVTLLQAPRMYFQRSGTLNQDVYFRAGSCFPCPHVRSPTKRVCKALMRTQFLSRCILSSAHFTHAHVDKHATRIYERGAHASLKPPAVSMRVYSEVCVEPSGWRMWSLISTAQTLSDSIQLPCNSCTKY